MDSKQNTFKSATSCTDTPPVPAGYSLKKQVLKKWIYENGHTQPYVAKRLNLPPEVFKENLTRRVQFNRVQLDALIRLMGAEEAFKVIYFPSDEERTRVFYEVFVDPLKEELRVK